MSCFHYFQSGRVLIVCWLLGLCSVSFSVQAQEIPKELQGIGITEHLGDSISMGQLTFNDEMGKEVRLADYFKWGRPVLLNMVYYGCANLCSFALNGTVDSLKKIDWIPGREFELVTVSIDPTEKPDLALRKKENYLKAYGKPEAFSGWHFLTGREDQIKKLASEVGFGYRYEESEKQYAHSAALFILTPEGKISRYLYGIEYPAKDLRLALVEASSGRIGTVIDRILLFCYRYDPKQRKYSVYLTRVMQASGAGTVVIFGSYLALFWRTQRRRRESNLNV